MNKITQVYIKTCEDFDTILVKFLKRPLFLEEKNALRNAGSFQMLESFARGIESIKNKEQAESEIQDLIKMRRLNDFIGFFSEKMMEKNIFIYDALKRKIEEKGNILDIMLFWDKIEENNLPQNEVNKIQEKLLFNLEQRK